MLAELAAANAAFGIIKNFVSNGKELSGCVKQISDFVFSKEQLEKKDIMPHYTKPLRKVIGKLKKASKAHAKQAKVLSKIEKDQRTRYKSTHGKKKKK